MKRILVTLALVAFSATQANADSGVSNWAGYYQWQYIPVVNSCAYSPYADNRVVLTLFPYSWDQRR
jgi:hypothetical protein